MAEFPFITDGIKGSVPINWYVVPDDNKKSVLYHSPGLLELCSLTDCTEIRGIVAWDDYLYVAAKRGTQAVLWKVSPGGTATECGYFTTSRTGKLWMANNSTQLVMVDGPGYVYTRATGSFGEITDAQWADAYTCSYQDGFGLFSDDDTDYWYHSELNDLTTYASADFYQKMAKTDGLTSVHSHLREPWIFGPGTTEVFYNAGGDNTSAMNPTFKRNPGGVIPIGIGAAASSVGDEHGLPMTWLTNYKTIVSATRYEPMEISNQMLARSLNDMATVSDAVAFGYKEGGHTFYQITFPSSDQTWIYDYTTKLWFRLQSYKISGGYGRQRANCYARMGNVHYVGDYENGKIYKMSTNYYDDNGYEIRRELYTKEVMAGMKRISFPDIMIDLDSGIDVSEGTSPTIFIQISKDGGNTYSSEIERTTGSIGDFGHRSIWRRLGSGYRQMTKVVVTDLIPWKVMGIY